MVNMSLFFHHHFYRPLVSPAPFFAGPYFRRSLEFSPITIRAGYIRATKVTSNYYLSVAPLVITMELHWKSIVLRNKAVIIVTRRDYYILLQNLGQQI